MCSYISTLSTNKKYGVGVAARATKDVRSLPQYLWAKVSKNVRDWGVSTGAKMELQSAYDSADMELCAENKDLNLEMRVLGTVGKIKFQKHSVSDR